jgi:hypothetical protein
MRLTQQLSKLKEQRRDIKKQLDEQRRGNE